MNKLRQKDVTLVLIMKITLTQAFMVLLFATFSYAHNVDAQEFLNKSISLKIEDAEIKKVLSKIESIADVKFVYSPKTIQANRKISVNVTNQRLGEVLKTIFSPLKISYQIIGGQILLNNAAQETDNSKADASGAVLDKVVSGKVTDEKGEGIPGVSIIIKGTTKGTSSDANGEFKITVPNGNSVLVFSSIGYTKKEVTVGNQSQITVVLATDAASLNEVVVTALGIEKSVKTLTYATQKLDGSQFTDVRDDNFAATLQGKVSGLSVTQSASGPGSSARVILRGNRSISGNNNALFVVDGVPIDNTTSGQVGNDFGGYNGMDGVSNINPDDIESVNVLKGAAASALYGSRAANGVILITTKKGKAGKISVDVNSGVNMESPSLLPSFQNMYGQGNGGVSSTSAAQSWGAATTTFPNNVSDFFQKAYSFNNSIAVTGGSEKMQTYFSYTNNATQGIVPTNDLSRNTLNLRINNQISKRLSTDVKITYVNQDIKNQIKVGEESGTVMNLYKVPRSVDLSTYKNHFEDANGVPTYWTSSSIYMDPYWNIYRTPNDAKRDRVMLLGSAKYELTSWLNLQGRVSLDTYNDNFTQKWYNGTLLFAQAGGNYSVTNANVMEKNIDILLSGNNAISHDFKVNYNFGAALNDRSRVSTQTQASGLLVANKFDLGFAANLSTNTLNVQRELQSVYGTAQFSFRDYLFLDLTARNDWSSTLPAPYSYFYPSVGLTAVLSDMMKMPDWITFAKVRGSYTKVGNDADPYLLIQTYSFAQGGNNGFISRDATKLIPTLKPELTNSLELGLDWRFFQNRLALDFTYYKTNSINQLLRLNLAPSSGFGDQYINAGNIQNSGIEFSLTYKLLNKGPIGWDMTLNGAKNVNKVIELDPNVKIAYLGGGYARSATPIVQEGGSYGDMVAYKWQQDAQGRYVVNANGLPVSTTAQQYIGNFNPNFLLGWKNTFTYKGFYLNILIDGRFGGIMTSGTDANLANDGTADYTTANRGGNWVLPAVTATGETNTKAINAEQFWTTVSQGRYSWGQFFTYDATNVRLREFGLGYGIPVPQNSFIKSAKLTLVGRNLFFFYRGNSILNVPGVPTRKMNFDPDISLGAGNFQGVEYGNLPSTRTIGLNLKLGF